MKKYEIRPIRKSDDKLLAPIIRKNLEAYRLNIPGTAYFDPELDHLSQFYGSEPDSRAYFVLTDEAGKVLGGAGFAEFPGLPDCAELQKLYLTDAVKGNGLGRGLVETVELSDRPFYVGVQYHPEFKSRPNRPHPLFCGFIGAALDKAEKEK